MPKRFILVSGNIGTGKTSLTEQLGARLGWRTSYESVEDNPFLGDFYEDMARWAFHLQVFYLGHRAQQHLELARCPESAVSDRSIYEDAHIFARALHHLGNLADRDHQAYLRAFELVAKGLPRPDLLIYLRAPVDVLIRRIRQRARKIEEGITAEYLTLLESYYREWIQDFSLCPILTLRTEDLNFVDKPRHLDIVVDRINKRLAGREDVVFPEDNG